MPPLGRAHLTQNEQRGGLTKQEPRPRRKHGNIPL